MIEVAIEIEAFVETHTHEMTPWRRGYIGALVSIPGE